MLMRWCIIFLILGLIVGLDQLTKLWVEQSLPLYSVIPVTSFFNVVHFRNTGAAFGFLSDPNTQWQLWFFLGTTLIALGAIFFLARSARKEGFFYFTGLGLIGGGAIGNAIDRIRLQEVIDFLDFHAFGYHWPAFNVADIAICCGVAILLYFIVFPQHHPEDDTTATP